MKKRLLFLLVAFVMLSMNLFAQNNCNAPTGLTASKHAPEWNNILLSWNAIVDSTQQDIMWSTTTLATRIGADAAADFIGTVRFEPSDLSSYAGRYLTSVTFVPGEDQTICQYSIVVWQGGSVTNDSIFDPGTMLVNQVITTPLSLNVLNTVLLDTALLIDVTQELWIGIRCNTTAGFPLGGSGNGVVHNKGELIRFGNTWETLTASELTDYNWIIIGHLQTSDNILSNYNLYRDNALLASVGSTSYLDSVPNGVYVYSLTAQYASGCESSPLSLTVSMEDNPCADCLDSVIVDGGVTPSTDYLLPLNTFYNYSFSEQIYTAAELGTIDGAINCISFQYIYGTAQTKDIVVYMGNTTKSSFSGGDWVPASQMFQVFNGTVNFTNAGADNWVNIPFDIPFEYDGTSNIVVAVLNNTGSYVTSSNPTFNIHSASGKSLYLYNDSNPYMISSLANGTVGSNRNNIRFLVGEPITCPMPTHLTVSDVTNEGATITWYSNPTSNGYELVFVPEGSTLDNETPITLSDTFYVASQLTPNTNYSVYLRGDCGGDNSNWNMQTFKTLCAPTTQLPYVMDMDGFGTGSGHIPDCSEVGLGTGYASYPYLSSSYHHSGNAALYFYSYSPNSSMIRLQGLDLTDNVESLTMSVWLYKTSAGYGRMDFGYMTDPMDFNTFVSVKSTYASDFTTSQWTEFKFALPESVNGQIIYPTLYAPFAPGSYSDYIYVDDVTIEVGQTSCMAPHNLQFSNVGGSSALLSWTPDVTAPSTATYHLEYTEAGTENWQMVTTTAGYYLLGGLTPLTQYDVRLYMDCDVDGFSDTLSDSFFTNCLAGGELAIGSGTGTNTYLPSYSTYNYTYSQQLFLASELNGPTTITSIAFDAATMSVQRSLSIYLMHTTETNASNWIPAGNAQLVFNTSQTLVAGWNTFQFSTPFEYNGTDNLLVIVIDGTGSWSSGNSWRVHTTSGTMAKYIYQDSAPYSINTIPSSGTTGSLTSRNNVIFGGNCDSTATCIAPNVVVTGYTDQEITLAWVAGDQETSWELEYKSTDTTDWTSVGILTDNTYTFSGLASSTNYEFRLRSVCSSSEFSNWTTASAFTVCDYITVPYSQNFETATGSGSTHYLDCWFRGTNNSSTYPYTSSSYASSGTYSLYFYGTSTYYCFAATPRFDDAVAMDSLQVNFNLYASTVGYCIEMGVMTDPTDYTTFVPVGMFSVPMAGVWDNYEITTANYSGNGHYLAFRIPQWGASYIYLDDIEVNYMNPCAHPTNIALQSVTPYEATIGWTSESDEWEYVYDLTGTVDLETASPDVVFTNSATITGLQPQTTYDFYVRSVCSGIGESNWSIITFTTECVSIDVLPYTQNFDSMTTATSNTTSGYSNLSGCWHAHNNGTSYTSYPYVYYSSSYASSGNYSLRFYSYTSSSYDDQYAILPSINTDLYPLNTLQLTFDAARYSTSYPFCVVVGAMTGTDVNTFQPIDTVLINSGGTNYDMQLVFLNNFTGTGDRLALMAPKNIGSYVPGAYYNEGHIDNVVISLLPTCPQPTHLNVDNVTESSVTLSWTENGTTSDWIIEYGPQGFTPGTGTEVQANSNPFTVDNLSAAVAYQFYVKADCGAGDESPLTGPVTATPGSYNMPTSGNHTITTCAMVIYDDGGPTGDYSNSCDSYLTINPATPGNLISIHGTSTTESNYDYLYIYDGAGTGGTLLGTYNGSGLTVPELTSTTGPLTIYFHSDPSVPYAGFELTVTCISNTCPAPTNLTVSNIGNTSATVSWTPTGSETSWIVEHKVSTASNWTTATVNTTTYQLTGLTGLTTYDVRVKADCGDETSPYKTATFTTPNCPATDACPYTFVLVDGYGDGWNDGYLTVIQGGATVATMEALDHEVSSTMTYDTVVVNLCDNQSTTLNWSPGSFDYEISVYVYGPDGSLVMSQVDFDTYTPFTFTTDCSGAPETCPAPTGLTATVDHTDVTLTWQQEPNTATEWQINYRLATESNWSTVTATSTTYTLTDLTANAQYVANVVAHCTNGLTSDESNTVTFETNNIGVEDYLSKAVTLYPNPATEMVSVAVSDANIMITGVEVYNVYGQLINTIVSTENPLRINVSGLADGMYYVRVTTDNGVVTKNFVKR